MSITKLAHAACIAVIAAAAPAAATVIADTPALPVLGIGYASASGVGCFPAAGVCVSPGTLTLTSLLSSSFDAAGQLIVTGAVYQGTLTTLGGTVLGPIALVGTVAQGVLGRTAADQVGSWATELVALSLSGPLLGNTLTITLDAALDSTGTTSIVPFTESDRERYRIDSFFDVFVELNLDSIPPLNATRGPIRSTLAAVPAPEPGGLAILGFALAGLAAARRRRPRDDTARVATR